VKFDPEFHHRRSVRLKGYDYAAPGLYFITMCTQNRECLFGHVERGRMVSNPFGGMVRFEWRQTAAIRPEFRMEALVVMPNHLHGLIRIVESVKPAADAGAPRCNADPGHATGRTAVRPYGNEDVGFTPLPAGETAIRRSPRSLASFVAGFKAITSKRINAQRATPGCPVWQRNYWEHIVRDDREEWACRRYIESNPAKWIEDDLFMSW
jgi:putative transposase